MNAGPIAAALRAQLPDTAWLDAALRTVAHRPAAIARLFPAAGRHCGRAMLPTPAGWSADDAARVLLLAALPREALAAEAAALYRYGDAAEKRAVLRALDPLELPASTAQPLLLDALRTNDTRLVAAALGPAARHLGAPAWRQGVLKAVFMRLPLDAVAGLDERADAELAIMLAGLAEERRAAGRTIPADAAALLHRLQERVP